MRRLMLQGTEINVSRLSFGTAGLHHLLTSRRRQDLLAAAFDHGFTHFDTAPYYGFGIAEQELGWFLKGRHGSVTLATKVGLYPPGGLYPNTLSICARKLVGKVLPVFSRPAVDWSISAAANSLNRSLRRLRVDQIDLLLLHEPVSDAVPSEEILGWLTEQRSKGKIRAWGLAGDVGTMNTWLSTDHPLGMVLQVRDSLVRREADFVRSRGRDLQITYGYLAASATTAESPPAMATLELALKRNATGSILVSTRQSARVGELAAVAEKHDGKNS